MKKTLILVLITLFATTLTKAEQVTSTAGSLSDVVTDENVTTLTVKGTIDAADFDFINAKLTNLKTLDLSDAEIVAYAGKKISSGRTASAANTLPEYALMGSSIETLSLPTSLIAIDDAALAASKITSLTIPQGVNSLGDGFCNGCHQLGTVTLPSSVTYIPAQAFKNCTAIEFISLPESIKTIGNEAFKGCTGLQVVDASAAPLTTIGEGAFAACSNLNDITFPVTLTQIGAEAFAATGIVEIDLSNCTHLTTIGGWAFSHCPDLLSATFPAAVTTIGDGIFFDCALLQSVELPAHLSSLSPYILKGTSLASTTGVINDNVETIGRYALYGNSNVTNVILPETVTKLDDKAMAQMSNLTSVDVTSLKQVPALGNDVFEGTASPDVKLFTSTDMEQEFKVAPQWKEFAVEAKGEVGGVTDVDAITMKVSMRYDGSRLHVKSPSPIDYISAHDMQGRLLCHVAAKGEHSASVELSPGNTVIITITLTDGTHTSAKIKL